MTPRVDEIASHVARDREFELERAFAWRRVGYARKDDPGGCETVARRVDEIARHFMADRDFENERAEAWRYVGWTADAD